MSDEQEVPETRGVTAELLKTIDLGPEVEGMDGRVFRMRKFTFAPGAVYGPLHDHKGRPGLVFILEGTITDHRDGVATDYGPGVGWPKTATRSTGSRTGEPCRRWRSRSTSSQRTDAAGQRARTSGARVLVRSRSAHDANREASFAPRGRVGFGTGPWRRRPPQWRERNEKVVGPD